jgi:N-sulfoglucosamine sulfohydrolase
VTNVVLIQTDDSGRYIGPYGHDVANPHLDRLADEGVLFRNAHCAGPTCSPSRAAMLTGESPHESGMIGLAHRGFSLDHPERHLAQTLAEAGFEAAHCGQCHETAGGPADVGYDVQPPDPAPDSGFVGEFDREEMDYQFARAAAEYLRSSPDGPYFCYLGLNNPHRPYPFDNLDVDPGSVQPPDPLPDVPAVRRDMAGYLTAARIVDDCVGHVMDALRDAGDLDDTIVVFTTDHGIAFPEMKCDLFEGGTGVSLLARFPDGPRGETEDALVSHLDLYPTLCESLGVDTPAHCNGESLRPLLDGETDAVRDAIFSEVTYHAAYEPKRTVKTPRYTYIRRYEGAHGPIVLPNTDPGPSKDFLLDHDYVERERPAEALYDRYHDPVERDNLIDDPAHEDVAERLRTRLDDWMAETDDPLLDGPVTKPAGAEVNVRDSVSPSGGPFEEPGIR